MDEKDFLGVMKLFRYVDLPEDGGWKEFIDEGDRIDEIQAIREHTMRGRPLGGRELCWAVGEETGSDVNA